MKLLLLCQRVLAVAARDSTMAMEATCAAIAVKSTAGRASTKTM